VLYTKCPHSVISILNVYHAVHVMYAIGILKARQTTKWPIAILNEAYYGFLNSLKKTDKQLKMTNLWLSEIEIN